MEKSNFDFLKRHDMQIWNTIKDFEEKINSNEDFRNKIRKMFEEFLDNQFDECKNEKNLQRKINRWQSFLVKNNSFSKEDITIMVENLEEIKRNANEGSHHQINDEKKTREKEFENRKMFLEKIYVFFKMFYKENLENLEATYYQNKSQNFFKNKELKDIFENDYLNKSDENDKTLFIKLLIQEEILDEFFENKDEIEEMVLTDNQKSDNEIDAFYYDKNNDRIVLLKTLYKEKTHEEEILSIIEKTAKDFKEQIISSESQSANSKLKLKWWEYLQEKNGNEKYSVKIYLTTFNEIKEKQKTEQMIESKLKKEFSKLKNIEIVLITEQDIWKKYDYVNNKSNENFYKIQLHSKKSFLLYPDETNDYKTILAIINAESLSKLFNKTNGKILTKNVRGYVKDKKIDDEIINSLKKAPQDFFILNNGITIVGKLAKNQELGKRKELEFKEFHIVNGGQTTFLINKIASENIELIKKITLFAKIIDINSNAKRQTELIEKIGKASNQQKPIKPEDMIATDPLVIKFKKEMESKNSDIFLANKRDSEAKKHLIKNQTKKYFELKEMLQIMNAFLGLRPDISRSNVKEIFDKKNVNNLISKINFDENNAFFREMLNIKAAAEKYKKKYQKINNSLSKKDQAIAEIAKNGMYYLVSSVGAIYLFNNLKENEINQIKKDGISELKENIKKISKNIELKGFLNKGKDGEWQKDDYLPENFENNIENLFSQIAEMIYVSNRESIDQGRTTNWSNLLKKFNPFGKLLLDDIFDKLSSVISKDSFKELCQTMFIQK